jgi:hypothetical protein
MSNADYLKVVNKSYLLLVFFALSTLALKAQQGSVNYKLQMLAGYSGPDNVPFWLRSNQFGSVPPSGASLGLIGAVRKDYNLTEIRKADWGFAAEGRINVGKPSEFILLEGYGKFRFSIFELKAGRVKDMTGLCDTTLTSGSWSVSGNALGVPKIQLAIPEFYTLPIFGKLFAFKGSYMHGWIGNWHINEEIIPNTPTYLHQKTLYGRFGKPSWKLKLYGGFNHQVVWGNEDSIMGEDYTLNKFETYFYVLASKLYNNNSIQRTRVGNSLGSIDLGLSYDFKNIYLFVYRQNFYDAGAIYYLANLLDGLNGVSLVNKRNNGKGAQWRRLLIEFLYTKNQAGEKWSRYTTSHYENYYNNGYYRHGWSYKDQGLGNPFISPSSSLKDGLPTTPSTRSNYFGNNRVIAFHLGVESYLLGWSINSKFSYSWNYGTYLTSASGKQYDGAIYPSPYGVFPVTGQLSAFIEAKKELKKGIQLGIMTALDMGDLYNDSFGIMGSISKLF